MARSTRDRRSGLLREDRIGRGSAIAERQIKLTPPTWASVVQPMAEQILDARSRHMRVGINDLIKLHWRSAHGGHGLAQPSLSDDAGERQARSALLLWSALAH